ncbi:hypothetical protein FBU59_004774 [Linderina macrospora]|uniref:Uncharacterized protein n=1 Tax=Linderina macrospora TaxID=4868 RepID=A0ACC1J4J4_9FUNG|nr:hypothetical protein FBU59_004774 [Linderina macrospora]
MRAVPPPQTILSPKILAAAKRKNIDFDDMVRESERLVTPEKRPRLSAPLSTITPSAQVTPEHQTGTAEDLGPMSATRYVGGKGKGDIQGGGRKHTNRTRRDPSKESRQYASLI